uniref:Ubiquitin carboxyl-terminal hydrolase n=1 Tax=Dermatophagoides pteronyssinus TaxID=6956 RepID=A0A6P6YJ18_DERPT|nr:ubiquitin carboxyl-terminal hydrolase 14-like [Dermatophagoides pteronyssinus]
MSTFNVKIKWNKETYDLELDTNESPSVFKAQIFALTGVSTDRQKVMFKGSVIKEDEWNSTMLKSIKNGATFLMMGSAGELPTEPQEKAVFVEDMTEKELADAFDQPSGLINLGNTCYLNATIQSLSTVPELRESLKKYKGSLTLNESFDGAHDIVVSLRDVYNKMDTSSTVMPVLLLEMLHMMFPQFSEKTENGQFAQQDANECWSELIKVLQQKLKIETIEGTTNSKNFITQYFGGTLQSTMKCIEDESEEPAISNENFLQLSCFISQDVKYLQTGLRLRLEEEINKFSTKLNRDAHYMKTSKISRLPAYLSINLIRFFYKEKNSVNAKILKDVKFSLTLDLYELCTPELQKRLVPMRQKFKDYEDQQLEKIQQQKLTKNDDKLNVEKKKEYYNYSFEDDPGSNNTGLYQLYAVLTHKGRSSSSGHYVGWIKHKDKWFKCDDEQVYQVTEEEILKLSGGGDWHCAYVLLYGPQLVEKCENLPSTIGQ